MRKILLSILITIFSVNIFSDDHGIKPGNVVAEFHYFDVTDPMTFVATVDKFDVSSCAQEWREISVFMRLVAEAILILYSWFTTILIKCN